VQRICFTLRVKKERIDVYRRRHAAVWPAMLAALSEAGWHNYSLFLAADGLLVGYLETDDFDLALERMKQTDVNGRWQAEMASFFVEMGDGKADDNMMRLEEVFHLA
jgi:L-rhamnose mutarotase